MTKPIHCNILHAEEKWNKDNALCRQKRLTEMWTISGNFDGVLICIIYAKLVFIIILWMIIYFSIKGIDWSCKKILATWKKIETEKMFRYIIGEIFNKIDRRVFF